MNPIWEAPHNRPDNLWYIFATAEERRAAHDALFLSWAELPDRCVRLNYAMTWKDVQGYGLEVAHAPAHSASGTTDLRRPWN